MLGSLTVPVFHSCFPTKFAPVGDGGRSAGPVHYGRCRIDRRLAVRQCPAAAWVLGASLCVLGWVLPAAAAAPKNVLILSEGPVLPYGVVLRETLSS